MKNIYLTAVIFTFFSCEFKAEEKQTGSTYKLYFAGGQSNMEGYGYSSDLTLVERMSDSTVMIFNGNHVPDDTVGGGYGKWMPLSSGFGTGYSATKDSVFLSNRFGPELSFGRRMAELSNEKVAIIKYARGGSSIALGASGFGTWAKEYTENTGINQWDHFYETVKNALSVKDIDGDGLEDNLIPSGIIWMQGEADAYDEEASKVYLENLIQLMEQITQVFGVDELPIVICRIEDSGQTPDERQMKYIEPVWEAQKQFAEENPNVELIQLAPPVEFIEDKWHYKSKHYIEMGNLFADKMMSF